MQRRVPGALSGCRWSWLQHLWTGLVPWEATPPPRMMLLHSEGTGPSRWLNHLRRGHRAFWASVALAASWRGVAGAAHPLLLTPPCLRASRESEEAGAPRAAGLAQVS